MLWTSSKSFSHTCHFESHKLQKSEYIKHCVAGLRIKCWSWPWTIYKYIMVVYGTVTIHNASLMSKAHYIWLLYSSAASRTSVLTVHALYPLGQRMYVVSVMSACLCSSTAWCMYNKLACLVNEFNRTLLNTCILWYWTRLKYLFESTYWLGFETNKAFLH